MSNTTSIWHGKRDGGAMMGRVMLLILVTGLFAGAWSSDHAPVATSDHGPSSSELPKPPDQAYPEHSIRETTLHRWTDAQRSAVAHRTADGTPTNQSPTPIARPRSLSSRKVVHRGVDARAGRGEVSNGNGRQLPMPASPCDPIITELQGQMRSKHRLVHPHLSEAAIDVIR